MILFTCGSLQDAVGLNCFGIDALLAVRCCQEEGMADYCAVAGAGGGG